MISHSWYAWPFTKLALGSCARRQLYVSNGCGPDAKTKSFFPHVSVVEGMESVPSVCVSVYALMAEPFDIRFQNMVEALTLISWMSSKVNVIGQRSRSPGWKTWLSKFQMVSALYNLSAMTKDVIGRHATASQCHVIWHDMNVRRS